MCGAEERVELANHPRWKRDVIAKAGLLGGTGGLVRVVQQVAAEEDAKVAKLINAVVLGGEDQNVSNVTIKEMLQYKAGAGQRRVKREEEIDVQEPGQADTRSPSEWLMRRS